ncbi:hypothetical protein L596_027248 [Steinernema carpocapsae]|uniref:Uncharacterized protein n=1 Tax=Steinernema carpocapsae TaxID=34508 RepID=A0A4U5M502_STECR|nr:hypothetical protein L596_027248 [Steinernema carpocapsae]
MTSNSEAPKQDIRLRAATASSTSPGPSPRSSGALESWSVSSPAARATERSKRTYTRSTTKRRSSRTWTSITPWSRDLWLVSATVMHTIRASKLPTHRTRSSCPNSGIKAELLWSLSFSIEASPTDPHLSPRGPRRAVVVPSLSQGAGRFQGSQDGFFPLLPRLADPRCRRRPLAPLFAVRDQTIVIQEPGYVLGLHRRLFDERLEYCSMPLYGLDFTDRNPQPAIAGIFPTCPFPFSQFSFSLRYRAWNMDIILSSEDKIAPPTPKRNLLRVEEQNFGPALFREQFRLTQTQTEVTRALRTTD